MLHIGEVHVHNKEADYVEMHSSLSEDNENPALLNKDNG